MICNLGILSADDKIASKNEKMYFSNLALFALMSSELINLSGSTSHLSFGFEAISLMSAPIVFLILFRIIIIVFLLLLLGGEHYFLYSK